MRNRIGTSLLLLVTFLGLVNAQIKKVTKKDSIRTKTIEGVVITATRTEKKLENVPIPVTVISKKELEKTNSIRLSDILNEQTGIVTIPGHPEGENFQMQGLDGGEYTLILLDGVPLVGRSNGVLDLDRISVGNIERIEVVKGASSSLYGNEALGGVINIITKKSKRGFRGNIGYRRNSLTNQDISAEANYKEKKLSISSFFNRNTSNGYSFDDNQFSPFQRYTGSANIGYDFTKKDKLLLSARYYTEHQENAETEYTEASNGYIREWNNTLKYDHQFSDKFHSYLEVYGSEYHAYKRLVEDNSIESEFKTLMLRPELRLFYKFNKKHNIIGGVGVTYEKLEEALLADNLLTFRAPYVYAQYDGQLTRTTNLIIGARFDAHNKYKKQLSPKIALKQDIIKNKLSFKGSIGYGYKTPNFRTLYYDFTNGTVGYSVFGHDVVAEKVEQLIAEGSISEIFIPLSDFENNELKPESSVAYNFGFHIRPFKNLDFNINFYRNDIKDLINSVLVAKKVDKGYQSNNIFSYQNVDEAYFQGIEVNGKYKLNKNFKFAGGYQLLYAYQKDVLDKFARGEVKGLYGQPLKKSDYFGLLGRSRHMGNLKVFYKNFKWNFDSNIRATYRGAYGIKDLNGNHYLDVYDKYVNDYVVVDFALNKTFAKTYRIGLGINNLLNFTDTKYIANIPGRIYYGALRINF